MTISPSVDPAVVSTLVCKHCSPEGETNERPVDMSDLSILQMLEQVPPGRIHVFEATPGYQPADQRFLIVTRSEKWDGTARATGMKWVNRPEVGAVPRTGNVDLPRRSLSTLQNISVELTGPAEFALDYYEYTSDICFISEKFKNLIESIDVEALEFMRADVVSEEGEAGAYYAAMPRRLIFAIDTRATNVTVENREFLPGKFSRKVFCENNIYIKGDVPVDVHIFKDYGDMHWFWSYELIELAKLSNIHGLHAKYPVSGLGAKSIEF